MISEIRPLPVGAALQLSLQPIAGALAWRILRKGTDTFTGETDAAALVAYEGTDVTVIDAEPGLVNEQPIFYRPYYWTGAAWVAGLSASGTPLATYEDASTDVQSLVRNRIEEGLKVEIVRGTFALDGRGISVYTAPPTVDQTEMPVVTVHLDTDASGERFLGELIEPDQLAEDGEWFEQEGWLADVSLEIAGWCVNPDERKTMRESLRRIVVGNLPVFAAAGMTQIAFVQRDAEYLNGEFGANVFQTVGTFTCQAPVIVRNKQPSVTGAEVDVDAEEVVSYTN